MPQSSGEEHRRTGVGGGVKGRIIYGEMDEFGRKVIEDPVTTYDFDATILHLLGFDHEKLTYLHGGPRLSTGRLEG